MNTKKLSYAESPIKVYQHHAFYLGALFTLGEAIYPYFYSNYIALTTACGFDFHPLRNNRHLVIDKYDYLLDFIDADYEKLTAMIKYLIEADYYIETVVDEYYIPNRYAYEKSHFYHNVLITGYDDDTSEFTVIGYTPSRYIQETTVSYQNLHKAIIDVSDNMLQTFKPKPIKCNDYNIKLGDIKQLLTDYLNAADSSKWMKTLCSYDGITEGYGNKFYGIAVLDELIDYYTRSFDEGREDLDIKAITIIDEYNQCMFNRIKFLKQNDYISDKNDYIENELTLLSQISSVSKNLVIKFNMLNDNKRKQNDILKAITPNIKEIKMLQNKNFDNIICNLRT